MLKEAKRVKSWVGALAAVGTLGLAATSHANTKSVDLFKFDGKTYSTNDLEPGQQLDLFEVELNSFQRQKAILEGAALKLHFAKIAKSSKKSLEDVEKEMLTVPQPKEADLKKFYEENKARIPYPYDQIKPRLTSFFMQQETTKKRQSLLAELSKKGSFSLVISEPVAPEVKINTKDFYVKGNKKGKIEVVEFADYQCPHCKQAHTAFKELLKKMGDKVRYVYIDFPVIDGSDRLAEGGYCANKQGKYWEYHDAAFVNQGKIKDALALAKEAGVRNKSFEDCYNQRQGQDFVQASKAEGQKVGVKGTPGIYINGRRYTGSITGEALEKAVKEAVLGKSS